MRSKSLIIKTSVLLIATGCSSENPFEALAAGDTAPGQVQQIDDWQHLFDGETLGGWRSFKSDNVPSGWVVENGTMSLAEPGGGDIMTARSFSEFELQFEWRISEKGNSGVIYLVNETPSSDHTFQTGPEYQVLDNDGHPDGQYESHRAGSLYDLVSPSANATRPVGEFNQARIIVQGGRIEHWLNGEKVVESPYNDDAWPSMVAASKFASMPEFGTFTSGHIAFQDHGDKVWYRNIKIREL